MANQNGSRQHPLSLDAVIHNGHIWDTARTKLEPVRSRLAVAELKLPPWCVWKESGQAVVFAALRYDNQALYMFSNRPRSQVEARRDSEVFDLGKQVLHREVVYDNYGQEPLDADRAYGIGRSLLDPQFEIVAANSGDAAHLTVMLTNLDDSTRALPNLQSLAA